MCLEAPDFDSNYSDYDSEPEASAEPDFIYSFESLDSNDGRPWPFTSITRAEAEASNEPYFRYSFELLDSNVLTQHIWLGQTRGWGILD